MMVKKHFEQFRADRFGYLLPLLFFVSCQTTQNLGQKRFSRSIAEIDLQGATSQVSSPELPNGGLGWVTVSVPLRVEGEISSGLEVSAKLLGEEKSNTDEVSLLFFESNPKQGDSKVKIFQAFLPIPYGRVPGHARVLVTLKNQHEERSIEVPFLVVEGKYPSEKLTVNPSRVHPRNQDLPRIARELKEVGAAYRNFEKKKFWQGPFVVPIQSQVTSTFGTRRVYNGALKGFHSGLDLRAAIGTPIYPAASGRVVLAKDLFFTGNTVIVDHGYGVMTLYAHMSELKVKSGDTVTPKELVGLSGKTGRVNGPHLHWQAVIDGVKVNPLGLTQDQLP